MTTVNLVSINKSSKAEITAWTVKSAGFGSSVEHPAGINVHVNTKNNTYEAVIPMTEIERVYLDYFIYRDYFKDNLEHTAVMEIGCATCEPCGADDSLCPHCTFDGECPCRLGC